MKRPYKIKYRIYPNSKQETVLIDASCAQVAIKHLRAAIGHICNVDYVEALEGQTSQEYEASVSFANLYKRELL